MKCDHSQHAHNDETTLNLGLDVYSIDVLSTFCACWAGAQWITWKKEIAIMDKIKILTPPSKKVIHIIQS